MTYPLNHKLTPEIVLRIKALLYEGATQELIGQEFGIAQTHVGRIAAGKSWPDVPWPDGAIGPGDPAKLRRKLTGFTSGVKFGATDIIQPDGKAVKKFLAEHKDEIPPNSRRRELDNNRADDSRTSDSDNPSSLEGGNRDKPPQEDYRNTRQNDPPRNGHSGKRSSGIPDLTWMDNLEALRDAVAPEAEAEILAGLTTVGKSGKAKPSKQPKLEDQKRLPWEHIVELAPAAKLVQLAEQADFLRPAVEIVFFHLPREKWNSAKAEEEVAKVARTFNLFPKDDEALAPIKQLKDD